MILTGDEIDMTPDPDESVPYVLTGKAEHALHNPDSVEEVLEQRIRDTVLPIMYQNRRK
jgi:hypothetical protein